MTSNHMGQGADNWGDPMSIVQGASADDLIQAGYGRAAAPAAAVAPEGKTMTDTTRPDGVAEIVRRLQACVDDPMWADHAEVSKATLREAIAALTAPASKPAEVTDKQIMLVAGECFADENTEFTGEMMEFARAVLALSHVKPAEPVAAQKSPSVSNNAVCGSSVSDKPAEGGVVDEQKAFEKEFGSADQQRLDSDGVARHAWARKGWMARAALAREGGG